MSGRPIRFLGAILALWTLGRIAFLLPARPDVERAGMRPVARAATATPRNATPRKAAPSPAPTAATPVGLATSIGQRPRPAPSGPGAATPAIPPSSWPIVAMAVAPSRDDAPSAMPAAWPALPAHPDRWSLGFWAVARRGGGTLTPGGQLGGSQAGVRLLRRIDSRGALSASLRLSAPSSGIGREAGVGLDWRPSPHLPVRLLVEQRLALDAGEGGTALLAVAGIGPRPIARGLSLAAYAQAGTVLRHRAEPFVDGAARLGMTLSDHVDLGLGLWGGAQREAQRLDIGPTLGVALPVADRRVRLSLDWRQRIAGRAAPGSGPALSLAGDF